MLIFQELNEARAFEKHECGNEHHDPQNQKYRALENKYINHEES